MHACNWSLEHTPGYTTSVRYQIIYYVLLLYIMGGHGNHMHVHYSNLKQGTLKYMGSVCIVASII